MPIPLLPLELIRLIAEYVVDDLDEHAGRAECFRLARVCKAWGTLVQPLAWRTLTVDPGIDMRPLDYVLKHPEVLRIVEVVDARCPRLSANNKVAVGEISEYHAARLVTLLPWCTSLTDLKLAPCAAPFRLLAATSVLPLASSLKTLALALDVDVFHCDFVVSCLARFAGLRTLHLFIECDEAREVVINPSTPMSTIPLRELKVGLRNSADFERLLFSLTSRINPLTLYRCALLDFCGSSILFDWLGKCQWLLILEITAFDEETLDNLFEDSADCSSKPRAPPIRSIAIPFPDPVDLMIRAITLIAFAWSDDEDDEWFVDLEDEYCGVQVQLVYMPDKGGTGRKRWYRVPWSADDAANV